MEHTHGTERDVLERGHVSEEVELLEDHPDLGSVARQRPTLDRHGLALEPQLTIVGHLEAVEASAQRGLTRPRRTRDHDHLSGVDVEVDVGQRVEVPVGLPNPPQGDEHVGGAVKLRGAAHLRQRAARRTSYPLRSIIRIMSTFCFTIRWKSMLDRRKWPW